MGPCMFKVSHVCLSQIQRRGFEAQWPGELPSRQSKFVLDIIGVASFRFNDSRLNTLRLKDVCHHILTELELLSTAAMDHLP
jgi:hypothetical protein